MNGTRVHRAFAFRLMRARNHVVRLFGFDRAFALALLAILIGVRILDPLPVEVLRLKVFDTYQVLSPRQGTARPVAILDIDEASIRAFGQWPWPRTRMADLVSKLKALGAVVVGFDIVFAEPDRLSPKQIADTLPDLDAATREKLDALPSNDDVLAAALRRIPTILGQTALATRNEKPNGFLSTGFATVGPNALPFVTHYPGLLVNVGVLSAAARGRGLFTIVPEPDGIVRRIPMVLSVWDQLMPSLTLDILRVLSGSGAVLVKTTPTGLLGLALPGLAIPTDRKGQIWVHFTAHDPRRFVSAVDLARGVVPRDRVAGKIVLVGTSAIGLLDNKTTPISRSMPGVEVQAQVLENVLDQKLLYEPYYSIAIELLAALAAGLLIVGLAPLLGPVLLLLLGMLVAAAIGAASWWSYRTYGALVDASFPLASSFVVYATLAFLNYFKAQVGRRRIRSAFSQYLSPALVEELTRSPDRLALGGETMDMSIMFSDVRGFTGISETFRDDPQGLIRLMNRFLTPLTNAILDHKGTIDKYVGDAIVAFWNAPLRDADHQRNACDAALDMQARLATLNQALASEEPPRFLDIGIGINTGTCVVGNMGSDLRFDYSVLGDAVNLASRLEGQSKVYGVKIILGAATAAAVAGLFAVLEIDLLQVKGKSEPQSVWTLLGDDGVRAGAAFVELAPLHAAMIAAYRATDFIEAEMLLDRCVALGGPFGLDRLYALYGERIVEYRRVAPPEDWSGVHVALTK